MDHRASSMLFFVVAAAVYSQAGEFSDWFAMYSADIPFRAYVHRLIADLPKDEVMYYRVNNYATALKDYTEAMEGDNLALVGRNMACVQEFGLAQHCIMPL